MKFKLSVLALAISSASVVANEAVVDNVMVVTAQRYEQQLNDVPMSLSVLDEETIQDLSIENGKELLNFVPNASLSGDGGFMSFPTIRGVGAGINNVEQSVAVYIDDVYQGSPRSFGMMLLDLEQVEVLRGPQGSLYGRNALGGAIKYVERAPDTEFSSNVEVGAGDLDYQLVKAGMDLPLVDDKLYSRVSVATRQRDGFIDNNLNEDLGGYEDKAARIKLLALATDNLDIQTTLHWTEEHSGAANYLSEENVKQDTRFDLEKPFFVDRENKGVDVKATYYGDSIDVHSITSYNQYSFEGNEATGNFQPFPMLSQWSFIDHDQISQEFRVTNTDNDDVRWTSGFFFYRSDEDYQNGSQMGPTPAMDSFANNTTTSYALYGKVDWRFTPRFSLGLGGRVTHDRKTGDYHVVNGGPMFKPSSSGSLEKTDFSPRVDLSYEMNENINTYASVARGYKAGGFNVAFISPDQGEHEYEEETAWTYEVGSKGVFLDQKLGVSTALFYTDWRNQQLLEYSGNTADIVNADKTKSYGGEIEINYVPLNGLDIGFGLGYTKAEFVEYESIVDPDLNANGNQLPYIPELSGNLRATYRFDMGEGQVMLHGNTSYQSKTYFDAANTYSQDDYSLTNFKVGYETPDWSTYLWVNNAFDKLYRQTGHIQYGEKMAVLGAPRTFGLNVKVNY